MKKYKVDVHFIQTIEVKAGSSKVALRKAIKLADPNKGFNDINSQIIYERFNFNGYNKEVINERDK